MSDFQMTDEKYDAVWDTGIERITGEAKEPFLIEPFCAQVAWMAVKTCPA